MQIRMFINIATCFIEMDQCQIKKARQSRAKVKEQLKFECWVEKPTVAGFSEGLIKVVLEIVGTTNALAINKDLRCCPLAADRRQ